jgi:hypothetical protein
LQKYWHKGAFHQDEEILQRHDFTEATESTTDVSMLPKVMQVKNFGKRSRTKYTHLLDQDTTAANGEFGATGGVKAGGKSTDGGGCFLCGGPHLKKGVLLSRYHFGRCIDYGRRLPTEYGPTWTWRQIRIWRKQHCGFGDTAVGSSSTTTKRPRRRSGSTG